MISYESNNDCIYGLEFSNVCALGPPIYLLQRRFIKICKLTLIFDNNSSRFNKRPILIYFKQIQFHMKTNIQDQGYTSKEFLSKLLFRSYSLQQNLPEPHKQFISHTLTNQLPKETVSSPLKTYSTNIVLHRVGPTVMSQQNVQKQNMLNATQRFLQGFDKNHSQKMIEQKKQSMFNNEKHVSSSTIGSERHFKDQFQSQRKKSRQNQNFIEKQQSVVVQKTILFLKKFLKGKLKDQQDFSLLDQLQHNISNPFQFDNLLQRVSQNKQKPQTKRNNHSKGQKKSIQTNYFYFRSKSQEIKIKHISLQQGLRNFKSLQRRRDEKSKSEIRIKQKEYKNLIKNEVKKIKDIFEKNLKK